MKDPSARFTPAMIVAAIALILALAGTAIAGPDAVTRAITGSKVKQIAKTQANKVFDQRTDLVLVESPTYSVPPGGSTVGAAGLGNFRAVCPNGYLVVGTGWLGDFGDMWYVQSYAFFVGGFGTNDASISGDFQLQAICAKSNQSFYRARATAIKSRADAARGYEEDNRADQAAWTRSND